MAAVLRRRWGVIALVALCAVGAAGALYYYLPERFTAVALLRLGTVVTGSEDWREFDIDYADRLMNTYLQLARTDAFQEQVLDFFPAPAADPVGVSLEVIPNTELLEIRAYSPDPVHAAALANGFPAVLAQQAGAAGLATQGTPVPSLAQAASTPTGADLPLYLVLGGALLLGLLVGSLAAFAAENIDGRLHRAQEFEKLLKVPVLESDGQRRSRNGALDSAIKTLAIQVQALTDLNDATVINVAGSMPARQRTSFAARLAYSLAHSGREVVLVDGDFNSPGLHTLFGISNETGLSTLLRGELPAREVIRKTRVPQLRLVTAGPPLGKRGALASVDTLRLVLQSVAREASYVIVDTPSGVTCPDALAVAASSDLRIFVARPGQHTRQELSSLRRRLAAAGAPLSAILLTHHLHPKAPEFATSRTPRVEVLAARTPGRS